MQICCSRSALEYSLSRVFPMKLGVSAKRNVNERAILLIPYIVLHDNNNNNIPYNEVNYTLRQIYMKSIEINVSLALST